MMDLKIILIFSLLFGFVSCNQLKKTSVENNLQARYDSVRIHFQSQTDGKPVDLYQLKNKNGIEVWITNYGARIVSIFTPDRNGNFADIVLGFSSVDGYLHDENFLGSIVGRYANRIADARFHIDGQEYSLAVNNGKNSLHGGIKGFDKVVWNAEQEGNSLKLNYVSAHMEEGYPGELKVSLFYSLNEKNELIMDYRTETNAKTVINLSNHAYYNLNGEGTGSILNHQIQIFADRFTPVDSSLIPTGELANVAGTPFDFRKAKEIGKDITTDNQQLTFGQGYDHNWVLNKEADKLELAARVTEPKSGRVLEILTTEPGLQFYSGNFLNGSITGKSGKPYTFRSAFVIEPQHFPDSPNHPEFPTTILEPGSIYHQKSICRFLVSQ